MRFNTQLFALSYALHIAHIQAGPVRWAAHIVRRADTSEPPPAPLISSPTSEAVSSSASTPRPIFRTLTSSTSEPESHPTPTNTAGGSEDPAVPLTDSGKLTAIEPLPDISTVPTPESTTAENDGPEQTASSTMTKSTQGETETTAAETLSVDTSTRLDSSVATTESLPTDSTGAIPTISVTDSSTQPFSTQSTLPSDAASTDASTGTSPATTTSTSDTSRELSPGSSTTSQTGNHDLDTTSVPEDTQPTTLPSSDKATSTLSTSLVPTATATSQATDVVSSQITSIPSVSQTIPASTLSPSSLDETLTTLPNLASTSGTPESTTTVSLTSMLTKTVTFHRTESSSIDPSTVSSEAPTGTLGGGSGNGASTSSHPPTTFKTETKKPTITRTHYVTVTADIPAPTSHEPAPPSQPPTQPEPSLTGVHSDPPAATTSVSPLPPSPSSDLLPSDGLVVITQSFPPVSQTVPPQGNPTSLVLIVLPDDSSSSSPGATYDGFIGDGATQSQIGAPTVSYVTVTVTEKEKETVTVTVHD